MIALLMQTTDDDFKQIIAEAHNRGAEIALEVVKQNSKDHYTESEVLRMFNISQGALANWRSDGRIAYEGTRGNLRYQKRSADELLSSLRRKEVT